MRRNASARRERFIVMGEVFVFIKQPFCSPDWLIVHCRSERGKEAVGRSTLSGVQTLVVYVLPKSGQLGKTNRDAVIRVYDEAGNIIETHDTRAISKSGELRGSPCVTIKN